jgi:hypothetical protein
VIEFEDHRESSSYVRKLWEWNSVSSDPYTKYQS